MELHKNSILQKALAQVKAVVAEQEKTLVAKISQLDGRNIKSQQSKQSSSSQSPSAENSQSTCDSPDDNKTEGRTYDTYR